jgi:5,10-methylenetetrahydromethanopterin reductase
MPRLGIGWLGEPPGRDFAAIARKAEESGFNSVWLAETRFTREAIVAASTVVMGTQAIQVGTAAVNAYTRGAALTAITFAALDELSGGRVVLGVGCGSPLVLAAQGYKFEQPGTRLREFVSGIRAVWRGEPFTGKYVRITGVHMEFTLPRAEIPIYLAVTGPKALALAGEVADGVILNAFTSAAYTRRAIERLRAGAERSGRQLDGYPVTGAVVVALDDDGRTGRDAVRPLVATYLTGFPNISRESGLDESELARYREARARGGLEAAAAEIPDEVVDTLTASGSAEDCRRRISEYRTAGITEPILFAAPAQFGRVVDELVGA